MTFREKIAYLLNHYGMSVYGMGEFTPDVETINLDEAMEHITGQDECMVMLYADGNCMGTICIVANDGEFEIYDYGSGDDFLLARLDTLTRED